MVRPVEVGDLGAVGPGELEQRLGVGPAVVARDGDRAEVRELEGLQRGEVGRVLDEHDVARVQERARDEPERLLGARGDQQVVRGHGQAAAGHEGGEARA
jgi:hypothetical protein